MNTAGCLDKKPSRAERSLAGRGLVNFGEDLSVGRCILLRCLGGEMRADGELELVQRFRMNVRQESSNVAE